MRSTRKKVIKTVYKDEDDSDAGETGDFSDSGSEAKISDVGSSSDEEEEGEPEVSSGEEFKNIPKKWVAQRQLKKIPTVRNKIKFAKEFISKIKQNSAGSDEENLEEKALFTVKDLTEADKLLPSFLNLSESDSSDDESPQASTSRTNFPSTSNVSQTYQSDSETETKTEYKDVWSENVQENSEEVAKKAFLELERHKSKIEETKASIQKYTSANDTSKELDVQDLLAQGEEVVPVPEAVKKILSRRKKKEESESEVEDWEEVNETKAIPQQGLQLFVDFPDGVARKSNKLDVEMMMKRKINRVKKEYQVYMHKVHVLCWVAHGNYVSRVLNDTDVMAAVLALVPSKECYPGERIDMKYVEQITTWYKDKLTLKQDKNEDKYRPKAPPLKEILQTQIKSRTVSTKKYLVFIFVCMLRALGLQCRVMFNFVTLPIKPPSSELCSLATKPKDESNKTTSKIKSKETESKTKSIKSKCKKNPPKSISQIDGNYDYDSSGDSEFDNFMQVDGNDDTELKTRSKRSTRTKANAKSVTEENKDDGVSPPKIPKLLEKSEQSGNENTDTKNAVPAKRRRTAKKESSPQPVKEVKKEKVNRPKSNKNPDPKPTEKLAPSPRKTRGTKASQNKAKPETKIVKPTSNMTISSSPPKIKVTNENGVSEKSSKYFENAEVSTNATKKFNLSRKRSVTATPSTLESTKDSTIVPTEKKTKSRTKSAPGTSVETSKYFTSPNKVAPKNLENKVTNTRQRRQKQDVLEDVQRISHRDLAKRKPKNDVTSDLVDIIKSRVKEAKAETKRKLVKGKETKESDGDSDYLPEEEPPKRRDSDSDAEFKPTKISPKPAGKRKIDRRVLSVDSETPKNKDDVWCEVFVEELEQWISVDVVKAKVHCAGEIYSRCTHPVAYIVGWDNNNHLKDVTRRYVPSWNTVTRKQRVEPSWWTKSISPWLGPKNARNKEEDEYLDRMQLEAPLPKSISEYKNHPLYALKRHLLKFEALYPADAATLGFVRGEAVYARECVHTCRSRDTWLKEAKTVRLGEKPYKVVKARPKWDKLSNKVISDLPLEVFGPWQVQDYEPPTAEDGVVPRNAYGNVELFKDCMLPKGTVHIKLPGLNKVAKKLQIDCAPAMTGFDFNGGYTHPVFDGFVVCSEFEEILTDAWVKDQEEQEKRELEKLEARVYGNWKRLIKGLLIRERLKLKYGFEEPSASKDTKKNAKAPKFVVKKR